MTEYDFESDKVDPKSASEFIKQIEKHCTDIPGNEVKLKMVKNKVLEKMKRTVRRERTLSSGGTLYSECSRSSSRTRLRSECEEMKENRHQSSAANRMIGSPGYLLPVMNLSLNVTCYPLISTLSPTTVKTLMEQQVSSGLTLTLEMCDVTLLVEQLSLTLVKSA